jgi:hypothetical protein
MRHEFEGVAHRALLQHLLGDQVGGMCCAALAATRLYLHMHISRYM